MNTIIVNGYTGRETDAERGPMYQAKLREIQEQVQSGALTVEQGADAFHAWLNHHYASYGAALYHNSIAGPAGRYEKLRRIATARVRECDEAYAELEKRTTTAWHAAHHRFVLAACEARARLVELIEVATEIHTPVAVGLKYVTRDLYEQMVPAEDRVLTLPDLTTLRAELDGFIETRRERFDITRATLAGAIPAGFEPAPEAVPQPAAADRSNDYAGGTW